MSDADGEGKKDYMKYCYYKRKKLLNHLTNGGGVGGGVRGLYAGALRQKRCKSTACGFQSYDSAAMASSR